MEIDDCIDCRIDTIKPQTTKKQTTTTTTTTTATSSSSTKRGGSGRGGVRFTSIITGCTTRMMQSFFHRNNNKKQLAFKYSLSDIEGNIKGIRASDASAFASRMKRWIFLFVILLLLLVWSMGISFNRSGTTTMSNWWYYTSSTPQPFVGMEGSSPPEEEEINVLDTPSLPPSLSSASSIINMESGPEPDITFHSFPNSSSSSSEEEQLQHGSNGFTGPAISTLSTVQVQGKGTIPISELQLGDKVMTSSTHYQMVYYLGGTNRYWSGNNNNNNHNNNKIDGDATTTTTICTRTTPVNYLQFTVSTSSKVLEVSEEHLIFYHPSSAESNDTNEKQQQWFTKPAKNIQIGDQLWLAGSRSGSSRSSNTSNPPAIVTHINLHYRTGCYAPLTMDGTIVVNGYVISTYGTLQAPSSLSLSSEQKQQLLSYGWNIGPYWQIPSWLVSLQLLHDILESPCRLVCRMTVTPTTTTSFYTFDASGSLTTKYNTDYYFNNQMGGGKEQQQNNWCDKVSRTWHDSIIHTIRSILRRHRHHQQHQHQEQQYVPPNINSNNKNSNNNNKNNNRSQLPSLSSSSSSSSQQQLSMVQILLWTIQDSLLLIGIIMIGLPFYIIHYYFIIITVSIVSLLVVWQQQQQQQQQRAQY